MADIKKVSYDEMRHILYFNLDLNNKDTDIPEEHVGCFYCEEDGTYLALDNRTEDCWVEEFDSLENCIGWLNDEFEISC